MQLSSAVRAVTKERYVATCQLLLVFAVVATVVIAVAGVSRLDIVGPHVSSPTGQTVHGSPAPAR
ncbi:MAG: hypothetical protein ACTHJM_03140 [Marmoricola sp.]